MTAPKFKEEELMAFADGEADETLSAAIRSAAIADETIQHKIDAFRESRRLAKLSMPLAPVDADLEARIRAMAQKSAQTTPSQIQVSAANDNRTRWQIPLAASIFFALGLGGGYLFKSQTGAVAPGINIAGLMDSELKSALESIASGSEIAVPDGKFRAIASFRDSGARLCREFERDTGSQLSIVGVACHENGSWSVDTIVASGQTSDGYAPASSLEAIDAYMASIGAQAPLDQAGESTALKELAKP